MEDEEKDKNEQSELDEEKDKKEKTEFGAENFLALANGATGLLSNTIDAARLNSSSPYESRIRELRSYADRRYTDFDDLSRAYSDINGYNTYVDFDVVRGRTSQEDVGNLLSSAATGASAGATFGGYGAAIGAAAGLGAGAFAMGKNLYDALGKKSSYESQFANARQVSRNNLGARHENLLEDNFANAVSHVAKQGGNIERKPMTIQEFADRVMKRSKANEVSRSAGIQRIRKDGGVCIRIKR